MKRASTSLLIFLTMFMVFGALQAETISVSGDYTTPGTVLGDLIIENGSINITSAGDLTVIGDVKVTNGSVTVSNGKLTVRGDLIVTNTTLNFSSGSASIVTNNDIDVSGAILAKSTFGDAYISTSLASSGGTITAESITTSGDGLTCIWSYAGIDVTGKIAATSISGDAYVVAGSNIAAAGLITTAQNDAHINALGNIFVRGTLQAESANSVAWIAAVSGITVGGDVITIAADSAYVMNSTSGNIEVLGNVRTKSTGGVAYVLNSNGMVQAGSILTDAYDNGQIMCRRLYVTGNIETKSLNDSAAIEANGAGVWAVNITTSAAGSAYISAYNDGVEAIHNISTFSQNDSAYVEVANASTVGDIKAYNIVTNGYLDSSLRTVNGSIKTKGFISTKSTNGTAYVSAPGAGSSVKALEIFTNGVGDSYVRSAADAPLYVRDAISAKSTGGMAYVSGGDLSARYIETNGYGASYVSAAAGINVECDIKAASATNSAYVQAQSGKLYARSVKASAAPGFDGSVKSSLAGGRFQLFSTPSDITATIKNAEFFLDKDYDTFKTAVSVEGTCTFDGNGHRIALSDAGGFLIKSGGSLILKNLQIDKIGTNAIRGEDNTVTLSLMDVVMTQTADTVWSYGRMQFSGLCDIEGNGTAFLYESSITSTIYPNSTLFIGDGVTLKYNSPSMLRLWMMDKTSKLQFNGGSLLANTNLALLRGTGVFDRDVVFESALGKTIYFGDNVPADQLDLDFHLRSRFSIVGTFTNVMP
jgi:hypothetical protein